MKKFRKNPKNIKEKVRQYFKEMKKQFLSGSYEGKAKALLWIDLSVVYIIFLFLYSISYIVYSAYGITWIGIVLFSISLAVLYIQRIWMLFAPISIIILCRIFARYGNVVHRRDWKNLKKFCPKGYKLVWSKKAIGKCYDISWIIALYIKDAKLMYCSIRVKDGSTTAHSVIVKDNCVYDTNKREHFDYDEYLKDQAVEVYKIFDKDIYQKESFFDDIRDDFVKWCSEKSVICYF